MRVGFIGIGRMGSHMARHLQDSGHQLQVFDLSRAATEPLLEGGAQWASSPRAADAPRYQA